MTITEFSLRIQHGIAGGFAPALPESIYTMYKSAQDPIVQIASSIRPLGTPVLQEAPLRMFSVENSGTSSLVDELYSILKGLPTEIPAGSQDIYGLDTSIELKVPGFWWRNGAPQGCGGAESTVHPTQEQKKQFKRAVQIANELVGKED